MFLNSKNLPLNEIKNAPFSLSTENTLFLMEQKINLGAEMKRRQGWN